MASSSCSCWHSYHLLLVLVVVALVVLAAAAAADVADNATGVVPAGAANNNNNNNQTNATTAVAFNTTATTTTNTTSAEKNQQQQQQGEEEVAVTTDEVVVISKATLAPTVAATTTTAVKEEEDGGDDDDDDVLNAYLQQRYNVTDPRNDHIYLKNNGILVYGKTVQNKYGVDPYCDEIVHEVCIPNDNRALKFGSLLPKLDTTSGIPLVPKMMTTTTSGGGSGGDNNETTSLSIVELALEIAEKPDQLAASFVNIYTLVDIIERWDGDEEGDENDGDGFRTARMIGFKVEGIDNVKVNVFQVGLVVENFISVDFFAGTFTVDVKVFLRRITLGQPHRSLKGAIEAVLLPWNQTNVVRISRGDYHYYERLNGIYASLLDDGQPPPQRKRDRAHPPPPVARLAAGGGDNARGEAVPVINGMCRPGTNIFTRPLTMEEYEALGVANGLRAGGGLRVMNSAQDLRPIADSNGYLSFLFAKGMTIGFSRANFRFFPFQKNLMDVALHIPALPGAGEGLDAPIVQTVLCYTPDTTGFRPHMRSVRATTDERQENHMFMIPYLFTSFAEPWYTSSDDQMDYGALTEEKLPNRLERSLRFRIVWSEPPGELWMVIFPFLFSAFSTQLQWLVLKASEVTATSMISAILLISNIVNAQKGLVRYNNIASSTIYLTYGIVGVYILAVAIMAFINIARNSGTNFILVRYQGSILRYMRLSGLLLTPFYIPLLVFYSNDETGEQHSYQWLWWTVFVFDVVIFAAYIARDWWKVTKERRLRKKGDQEGEFSSCELICAKPVHLWTVEEVGKWIRGSEDLREISSFTDGEREAIAEKFKVKKVDGTAFINLSKDAERLVKFLDLAIGEALHFSANVEKLVKMGVLKFDNDDGDAADTPTSTSGNGRLEIDGVSSTLSC